MNVTRAGNWRASPVALRHAVQSLVVVGPPRIVLNIWSVEEA